LNNTHCERRNARKVRLLLRASRHRRHTTAPGSSIVNNHRAPAFPSRDARLWRPVRRRAAAGHRALAKPIDRCHAAPFIDGVSHHDLVAEPLGSNGGATSLAEPIDPSRAPKVHVPPLNHIGLWVDALGQ
jgi:hypothetical protein